MSAVYEDWDPTKTIAENSRTARNNMLFEIIWHRMEDPETARMRLTPGGFERARKAARFIREILFNKKKYSGGNMSVYDVYKQMTNTADPEPNYSVISVDTLLTYNEMNQIADKLIGVFANHNSNAMMASLMHKLRLGDRLSIKFGSLAKAETTLLKQGEPVTNVGTELLADTVVTRHKDGTITTRNIQSSVHELIAAAVDAVKDPVLNFLGLNTTTATAGALLARLGYTADDIGLLFNQPVVIEVVKKVNEGSTLDQAIVSVKNKLSNNGNILASSITLTEETLIDQLTKDNALSSDASIQLAVLDILSTVLDAASKVNDFVGITKNTASNSVGSTFAQMYYTQHKYERIMNTFRDSDPDLIAEPSDNEDYKIPITDELDLTSITDVDDYLGKIIESPFAYEQAAYDCNKAFVKRVSDIFPYETETYKQVRAAGYMMSLHNNMSVETIEQLHNDILMYALSARGTSKFDPYNKIGNVPMIDYCLKNFPAMLYDWLYPSDEQSAEINRILSNYELFNYVDVVMNDKGDYEIHILGYKDGMKEFKYELSSYFDDVFFSENPSVANIGLLLVMYHYFTTGFSFNKTSYADMISPLVMASILANNEGETYFDVLNMVLKDLIEVPPQTMITKFVQNHPENRDFVYMPSGQRLANISKLLKDNQTVSRADNGENILTSTIPIKEAVELGLVKIKKDNDTTSYVPVRFANIEESLWSYQSSSNDLAADTQTVTFVRLPILGDGKYRKVYTSERFLTISGDTEHSSGDNTTDDTEFTPHTPEDLDAAYIKGNFDINTIRQTYLGYLMALQGVDRFSDLSGEYYTGFDRKILLEKLTDLFNDNKEPIIVFDMDGSPRRLC